MTLVFPVLGNHDTFPVNVEDMDHERDNLLVQGVADVWEHWIGKEAADEFREHGYYSTLIEADSGPLKNLSGQVRVIGLNTNACND